MPFWRDVIELLNFILLFVSFIVVIQEHELATVNFYEAIFLIFAAGLLLDEASRCFCRSDRLTVLTRLPLPLAPLRSHEYQFAASREHGLAFYLSTLFNAFDLGFIAIVLAYAGIRIQGFTSSPPNLDTAELAFDTLACGAALLFPRLAFTFVQGNVILIA